MALSDIPKFQAAVSEDADLLKKVQETVKSITSNISEPLNADSNVDWSPILKIAESLGLHFSADELKEAFFGGGRELSDQELEGVVGAGAGLFTTISGFNTNNLNIKKTGIMSDTIHGSGKADTVHGVTGGISRPKK